jgi:phenylacetate-CoA ligase
MFRKLIANYLGFPIHDFVKKTKIISTLNFLKESQYWDEDSMNNYRLLKLQRLIKHAFYNVPYYRELFNAHGIRPEDIKSLDDIKRIPILTKELARANQKKLIADNINFSQVKRGKTGGTTGVPLEVYSDANNRSYTWASYYRWYNWINIDKGDRVLTFWGAKTVLTTSIRMKFQWKLIDWFQNNKTINSFGMSENTMPGIYAEVIKYNPILIKGYLSAILLLAEYMKKNKLPPNKGLRALSCTSETLLPSYRQLIEEVFSAPIYDQYGCGEVSAISYECSKQEGLHINEEHVLVECIESNDLDVVNEEGRLIVTSLDNYVMPFIRYENGDTASIYTKKCSCKLPSQLMSSVVGRTTETITLKNGGKVHGVFFTDILDEIGITTDFISRFQIVQYKSGSIDFKLETRDSIPKEMIDRLESESLKFINYVRIILVDHISNEENGKYKYIKLSNN